MKKIIALLLVSIFLGLTGCQKAEEAAAPADKTAPVTIYPTKPAGPGGRIDQEYYPENGQYKSNTNP